MSKPDLTEYYNIILELSQKWLMGLLTEKELELFSEWFASFEGLTLNGPEGQTVEKVEHYLHLQMHRPVAEFDEAALRAAWGSLRKE